ncbi:MAG TPA: conjugal transfer protein TraD, partial [Pseudorhodoferax sp.]|nr:conjugal transfer protein TraD [Pseudorhodoferax sp.]
MLTRRYEMPWRAAYEAHAGLAWLLSGIYFAATAVLQALPAAVAWPLAGVCLAMATRRTVQAVRILRLRGALTGRRIQVIGPQALARLTHDLGQVFLGFGFEWQSVHAQRLYELSKVDYRAHAVPRWLQRPL